MSTNETQPRKSLGIALLFISGLLIVGVMLPWVSLDWHWDGGDRITAEFKYILNGLGVGQFSTSADVNTDEAQYNIQETWNVKSLQLPIMIGTPLLVIAVLNLVLSLYFLHENTRQVFPPPLKEVLDKHYSLIILIEGMVVIGVCVIFSLFYFKLPLEIPLANLNHQGINENFTAEQLSLLNYYKNVFNYFVWTKDETGIVKMTFNGSFRPGFGFYLSLVTGILLIYTWFLNLMLKKEDWPSLWRKRGFLGPLLIILAFMPSMIKISSSEGLLPPMVLSPVSTYLGIAYFVTALLYLYLIRKVSFTEKELNSVVRALYTAEKLKEAEVEEYLKTMETIRAKISKYRKYIGATVLGVSLFAWGFVVAILTHYLSFMGSDISGHVLKVMRHTPSNWLLLFTPLANLVVYILFNR
ncbi:MAG: hypothetical protein GWO20_17800 [Candidatus Korarchaeota archaeon]|nr:hypothetical protein [Candidatus Korarchaeota archaeon]NIU83835.1 hypothetical protein [Candidatus Thorarchaeota archaeon]NIW15249.1 hypothetical protein [Candidatus Thorarchaeota archaeon]NIW53226.1 hypothetical protein [Candidatus Korarchaeota archaeon]